MEGNSPQGISYKPGDALSSGLSLLPGRGTCYGCGCGRRKSRAGEGLVAYLGNQKGAPVERDRRRSWRPGDFTVGALVCLPLAVLHLASVERLVGRGDSAEFAIVAGTLGIAHPTGYPIYTLVGRLFCLVPGGSVAFKVNLMSAVFGSIGLLLVFRLAAVTARYVSGSTPLVYVGAGLAAAVVGLSPVFSQFARIAEVYTLSLLLVALACCLASRWVRSGRANHFYGTAAALGLALGAHLSTAVIAAGFLVIALLRRVPIRRLLGGLGLFVLGGSQYLYLLIRSGQNPAYVNPNGRFFEHLAQTGTDNGFRNWLWFVTGGPWRDQYARSFEGLATKAGELWAGLSGDFPALLGCALVGAALLPAVGRARAGDGRRQQCAWQWAVLAAVVVGQGGYYVIYRASQPGMVLPLVACVAVFAGVGLVAAASLVCRRAPARLRSTGPIVLAAVAAAAIALPGLRAAARAVDGGGAAVLVERMIDQLPRGAVLDGADWKYGRVIDYYRIVEGREIPFDCRACDEADIAGGKCFVLGSPKTVRAYQRAGLELSEYLRVPGQPPVYTAGGPRGGQAVGVRRLLRQ
jgi:hypothetical protein